MTRRTPTEALRPELIKRVILYGILLFLTATAQCSFFARLTICPVTPDLMLGLTLAVLLLDSPKSACVVGIAAGYLIDGLGATGLFFSPLFYLIVTLCLAMIAQKMLPRFLSFGALLLPTLLLRALYTLLCLTIHTGGFPALSYALPLLLREGIVTWILCLPLYPIVRLIMIPIQSRNRFRF